MDNIYNEYFFHNIVWTRFIRMPYGHLLDYAGKNGENYFPSAEECRKAIPNPRSWGLPIENGGFFTGLYTYALLEKYKKSPSEQSAREINILVNGLFLLQDVSCVDGFIARGVGDDGKSHYPMSAECQIFPWVLALFSYYKSDLCNDKDAVKDRLLRVLTALRDCGWRIPCDVEGVYYKNNWYTADDWRNVVLIVSCARFIYELTKDKNDLELFESLINTTPTGSIFSRKEIISHGYGHDMIAFLGTQQTWICTYTHLAIKELKKVDETNRDAYNSCLYNNGLTALKCIGSISKYDNSPDGFDIDWRPLKDMWEPFNNDTDDGTQLADKQFTYWHKRVVPHRFMEHHLLGNALFSAWVAASCENKKIAESALSKLEANIRNVDWENLHLSYAFVVESAFYANL